jgi:hypothetical protein
MRHFITLVFAIAGGVPLASFGIGAAHARSDTFNLFGYGPGIGGFPIVEIDGQELRPLLTTMFALMTNVLGLFSILGVPYIGDQTKLNNSVDVAAFSTCLRITDLFLRIETYGQTNLK